MGLLSGRNYLCLNQNNMARKSKRLQDKLALHQKEQEEMLAQLKEVQEREETERLKAEEEIKNVCGEKYFCGVIVTKQDILNLIDIMLKTGENISIPFKLYFNDREEPDNN